MEFSTLMGLIAFVAGGATLVWAWFAFHRALVTMGWPSVPGAIVSSRVSDAGGPAVPVLRGRYSVELDYQYRVNGEEYSGGAVSRIPYRCLLRSSAERVASRYPAGEPVRVFHHPDDPSLSVLDPGTSPENYRLFLLGALFLGIGTIAISGFPE